MKRAALLAFLFLLAPVATFAQSPALTVPQASPRASVLQRVGLTDITVTWSRPAVNNRKVWDGLVPYGKVWRAGANENTTIAFSTAVSIDGKSVPAGTYGLHMIPTQSTWTVILSKVSTAWGSFDYDEKSDQLRFSATPEPAPQMERLSYSIDDPAEREATVALRWEKVRLPFKVSADTPAIVMDSVRKEMHGIAQFFPKGWADAAGLALRYNTNLDEAVAWADRSMKIQPTFEGLMVKANLLDKKGDSAAAGPVREKAFGLANEVQMNLFGYNLLGQPGKEKEAIAIFERNVKAHPESWNVYDSLGEAQAKVGDKAAAQASFQKAHSLVKDAVQKARIEKTLAELR